MYSLERLRDISDLEQFLGILPGERVPYRAGNDLPFSDDAEEGRFEGVLNLDSITGEVRYTLFTDGRR